jgi:glycerophosphoryl diester phosphodiesterase
MALPMATDSIPVPDASTVDELLALDRPVTLAHAGGDFAAPHSTLFAFTQAAIAGIDALEMDVMLTADGVLVVQHDDTVDRTTDATGPVRTFSVDALQQLDNAYWFSGDVWIDKSLPDDAYLYRGVRNGDRPAPVGYVPDDFAVPTFREVAERFPHHVLDVEIKIPRDEDGDDDLDFAIDAARVLADEIEQLGRTGSVIVVSFDDQVLDAFRGFAPQVATSPGLGTLVAWYAGGAVTFAEQDVVFQAPPVFEGIEVLTNETIDRAVAEGYPIWAWMNDGAQETTEFYRELFARGVDGVITSRHAEAVDATVS